MRYSRSIHLVGLGLLFAGTPAVAQLSGRVVITPYAGAFLPSNDIVRENFSAPGVTASVNVRHEAAFASGANASYWVTDRFAIELGGLYSWTKIKGNGLVNEIGSGTVMGIVDNAHVLAGSAKAMFQLLPPDSPINLRFGVGPAVISRGGPAYKADADGKFSGLTDVGAAASLCTRIPMTEFTSVRLRVEDYIYQSRLRYESPDGSNLQFGRRNQNDILLSLGLQLFVTP